MESFSTVVFYLRPNRDRESAILMESLFRLTQKALLSGSLSATDAGAVLRCVDAVVARGCCGYLAYLEADLLKADTTDKGDDGEKNTVKKSEFCTDMHSNVLQVTPCGRCPASPP